MQSACMQQDNVYTEQYQEKEGVQHDIEGT